MVPQGDVPEVQGRKSRRRTLMSYGDRPTTDVFAEYEIFLQPISINHSESHLSPFQLFSLSLSLFHIRFSFSLSPVLSVPFASVFIYSTSLKLEQKKEKRRKKKKKKSGRMFDKNEVISRSPSMKNRLKTRSD